MRTITTIILLSMMMGCATSQEIDKDFTDFYNKYEDDEGIISFQVPIALARFIIDNKDKDSDEFLHKMDKIRFFISEHDNGQYVRRIGNYLPNSVYHDLMIIKDDGATVVFKVKESHKGIIREIVMTVSDPDSFVAISFMGNFTYEDAKKMTSSIKSGNMVNFRM